MKKENTFSWIDEDLEHDDANEVDKEDDERDEEIEEFEEKYNFRFEEPDSNKIISKFIVFSHL